MVGEGEGKCWLYVVGEGMWRGDYVGEGVDVWVWFGFEGD